MWQEAGLTDRSRRGMARCPVAWSILFMRTERTRRRLAWIERQAKRGPTDLTEMAWERIAPLLAGASGAGRPQRTDLRKEFDAIRDLVRTGCGWRPR